MKREYMRSLTKNKISIAFDIDDVTSRKHFQFSFCNFLFFRRNDLAEKRRRFGDF